MSVHDTLETDASQDVSRYLIRTSGGNNMSRQDEPRQGKTSQGKARKAVPPRCSHARCPTHLLPGTPTGQTLNNYGTQTYTTYQRWSVLGVASGGAMDTAPRYAKDRAVRTLFTSLTCRVARVPYCTQHSRVPYSMQRSTQYSTASYYRAAQYTRVKCSAVP